MLLCSNNISSLPPEILRLLRGQKLDLIFGNYLFFYESDTTELLDKIYIFDEIYVSWSLICGDYVTRKFYLS